MYCFTPCIDSTLEVVNLLCFIPDLYAVVIFLLPPGIVRLDPLRHFGHFKFGSVKMQRQNFQKNSIKYQQHFLFFINEISNSRVWTFHYGVGIVYESLQCAWHYGTTCASNEFKMKCSIITHHLWKQTPSLFLHPFLQLQPTKASQFRSTNEIHTITKIYIYNSILFTRW